MSVIKALGHELIKLKDFRPNRNIITYLICVVIASILWFLNALNKDYSAELSYPVKYINFPEGKYSVIKLPSQLQLEVKAKGFALLGHHIKTSFLPITFNVSTYSHHLKNKDGIYEYILNTNDIKDKIGSQLSSGIKLLSVNPEEIIFRFADARQKKVAVKPDVRYTLKRQYILNRISASPDSVWVSGPAPVIDTLRYVTTEPLNFKEVGREVSRSVHLAPLPECSVQDQNINVTLEVEQFTEAKRTLPIVAERVPESMNMRLFPPTVNISYEVGLSKYDQVKDSDFVIAVVYPKDTNTPFLEVQVRKAPAFITNLTYTPQKVEYILEKK